jgi:hypothetical protein
MSRRTCPRDGLEFDSLPDYMVHLTLDHDGAARRAVTCRACAKDIDVNVTRTCECGYTLPDWGFTGRTERRLRKRAASVR